MKNLNQSTVLNAFAKISLYFFYFSVLLTVLCNVMPWSTSWSLIEMPLLFAPRWWIFLLLLPVALITPSKMISQWKSMFIAFVAITFFYFGFHLPNNFFSARITAQPLPIMSINLGGGVANSELIKQLIVDEQLVLIAFQETPKREAKKIVPQGWDLHCIGQMCLASAYKITFLNSQSRKILGGWGHFGLLYQVQINERKVNIMNLHLETPRKGFEDFQLSKLNLDAIFKNSEQRYIESSIISSWIKNTTPLIILGDFNMPIESAIYREKFGNYKNAFNEAGFGFGFTKYMRYLGVRIDHILTDESFNIIEAKTGSDVGSDHLPILTIVMLNTLV
tara:strand:- start:8587 stop:9591 length:1005 start_codon:yes stop_codon:yes gene_type:complete